MNGWGKWICFAQRLLKGMDHVQNEEEKKNAICRKEKIIIYNDFG
jgi:hypothetical protein